MTNSEYRLQHLSHFANVANLLLFLEEEGIKPEDAAIGGWYSGPGNAGDDEELVLYLPVKDSEAKETD